LTETTFGHEFVTTNDTSKVHYVFNAILLTILYTVNKIFYDLTLGLPKYCRLTKSGSEIFSYVRCNLSF